MSISYNKDKLRQMNSVLWEAIYRIMVLTVGALFVAYYTPPILDDMSGYTGTMFLTAILLVFAGYAMRRYEGDSP